MLDANRPARLLLDDDPTRHPTIQQTHPTNLSNKRQQIRPLYKPLIKLLTRCPEVDASQHKPVKKALKKRALYRVKEK